MKCPSCSSENKDAATQCKKCGMLLNVQPMWSPDWHWHAKVLGTIYVGLIIAYFFLTWALKPYLRDIPPEVTPWLKHASKIHK